MSGIVGSQQQIIDKVLRSCHGQLPKETSIVFEQFLRIYYDQVPLEELSALSIDQLYGLAWSHWQLMQQRKLKTVKLRVFNPTMEHDGFTVEGTLVQLSIDDMPFIVDSMRMAVTNLGYDVEFMVHTGGLLVERDRRLRIKKIQTCTVISQAKQDSATEAPVALYISQLSTQREIDQLRSCLEQVLYDLHLAYDDWPKMCQEMVASAKALRAEKSQLDPQIVEESAQFLEWLLDNHFIFLGCADYQVTRDSGEPIVEYCHNSALGVFHENVPLHSIAYSDMTEKARTLAKTNKTLVVVCKSDIKSSIHRDADMDLVIIKQFDQQGNHIAERQFYGLFTSSAYASDPKSIPILRNKLSNVLSSLNVRLQGYAGKDLKHILINLPRDALFECDVDELATLARGILHLQEKRKLRLFVYRSVLGKTLSCLLYMPRDSYHTELLYRMQAKLESYFSANDSTFSTYFGDSALAQTHYMLHVGARQDCDLDYKTIEAELSAMSRSWQDDLHIGLAHQYTTEQRNVLWKKYAYAFPAGYREDFSPAIALEDIAMLESLCDESPLDIVFHADEKTPGLLQLKFFHAHDIIPLSDVLPMFENMGLRVIAEHPYEVSLSNGGIFWINDFKVQYAYAERIVEPKFGELLKNTMLAVWRGLAENDRLNRLILAAQLTWRQVTVFRAYAHYMKQTNFTYSKQYIEDTLVNYPAIVGMLFNYFDMRFNPETVKYNPEHTPAALRCLEAADRYQQHILRELDQIDSADEDRILRRYLELMNASLRTNFYQDMYQNSEENYLVIKFLSQKITGLPLPLPLYELYVYAPNVEGVHLRCAKVSRGGIRLSDRREDFRNEAHDLAMKAQRAKNGSIVAQGAKGCFVLKLLPKNADQDRIEQESVACYKQFINALLVLTDNIIEDKVVPPQQVVCYDSADSYFVVAADKGTATFSDVANQIAEKNNFWLGDAFASGGSAGYDHKKMGITAKGAWVSAEEHFRNLDLDLVKQSVRVVGIGDMSGDVFGNGMLLSEHIALQAAFNHKHIFIDPNPVLRKSFRERRRLFQLPRSSWDDYDRSILSEGGAIFSRKAKLLKLSQQAMQMLSIEQDELTPDQLIQAILCAPVDMLWNGGVGTFVKASKESHADAGDRANDNLRVNADQLRCKIICEGGNLGITQRGRIQYALQGGLVNADFIDNSGGVACSDLEVLIKIMLKAVIADTSMSLAERNQLLLSMTDEVQQLVLSQNTQQSRAITINTAQAIYYFNLYQRYMDYLVQAECINLEVEKLPSEQELTDRLAAGIGMVRPEVATLYAYSKIDTKQHLLAGDLLHDKFFDRYLVDAFPSILIEKYYSYACTHRLRAEVIATQLTNQMVSEMGLSFVYQMIDETNVSQSEVVRAYVIAENVFHHHKIIQQIESLNYLIPVDLQQSMYIGFSNLIRRSTRWLLRHKPNYTHIAGAIEKFSQPIQQLSERIGKLLRGKAAESYEMEAQKLIDASVPPSLAVTVASVRALYHTWNIVDLAVEQDIDLQRVAKIYFMLVDRLDLFWLREQIDAYPSDTRWSVLAKASFKSDLDTIQQDLTRGVIEFHSKARTIPTRVNAWLDAHAQMIERWRSVVAALRGMDAKDFAVLSVAIRQLQELVAVG